MADYDRKLLLLMDGHAMIFRAWFSIPERLSSSAGVDTRGVYGFMNTFIKVIGDHRPTHAAIAFDTRAPTFRDELYPQYKAQRPPTPEDLHAQIPILKDVMGAFGVPVFERDGFEADDLIGTIAERATELGIETLVVTGDADQLQLVSPTVKLLMYTGFANTRVYDVEAVKERYGGLGPESVPDIKALMGDPSDNIPGVPGVGEKATLAVLNGRGRLEQVYDDLDGIEAAPIRGAKRVRRLLEDHREEAFNGRVLTTIVRDVPIDFDLDAARFWSYKREDVVAALVALDFNSIIARVPPAGNGAPADGPRLGTQLGLDTGAAAAPVAETRSPYEGAEYKTVTKAADLKALVKNLSTPKGFAFDTETSGINPMLSSLVGVSLSNEEGHAWYVPVGHREGKQIPRDEALDILRPLFADPDVPKVGHNANFDLMVLEQAGLEVANVAFDTMVSAALSGRRNIGLKQLALDLYQIEMTPIKDLIGTGRKQITMTDVPVESASPYAAADADFTWRLYETFDPVLEQQGARKVFDDIEMPLLPVIVRMQRIGIMVDADALNDMSYELGSQLAKLMDDTQQLLGGREINLNSTRQLAEILIDEMGAPKTRRTKTGYAMDASTLETMRSREDLKPEAAELIDNVLHHRELSKLKSTYVDALPGLVNPETGRVHTSFNQVGSATGRLSSADPNVQNIPVRTELGRRVRKAFVTDTDSGWTLLAADYSQIELRILAHLSREPGLLEAFARGEDIHTATAQAMYEVDDPADVTDYQRRIAKILNFGVIYGLGPVGVARQTDLSRQQGQQFIDMYFSKYPGIRDYIDNVKYEARERGYVSTLTGRRRRLPDLRSGNQGARAAAERMAVNMPIQGTSADVIKIAMISIDAEMRQRELESRMLIQVHDELIFEAAPGELEEMTGIVREHMPKAMELAVPLDVEVKTGPTWGDMD